MSDARAFRAVWIEHLLLLAAIVGWIVWFCLDSIRASKSTENLMLVAPATALAILLAGVIAVATLRHALSANAGFSADPGGTSLAVPHDLRTVGFILLFCAYIAGLAFTYFDVATFVFVVVSLLMLGERKIWLAVVYSAVFAGLVTWALRAMVPFPFDALVV